MIIDYKLLENQKLTLLSLIINNKCNLDKQIIDDLNGVVHLIANKKLASYNEKKEIINKPNEKFINRQGELNLF